MVKQPVGPTGCPLSIPYSVPGFAALTWLDSAGAVKNIYTFPESFRCQTKSPNFTSTATIWTLEKFVTLPTNIASTSTIRKFNHYTQFSVITEQGTNLQTITARGTYETNNPDLPMDGYVTDGDDATEFSTKEGYMLMAARVLQNAGLSARIQFHKCSD